MCFCFYYYRHAKRRKVAGFFENFQEIYREAMPRQKEAGPMRADQLEEDDTE